MNKVVKMMITSDFFLNCGWGLLSPIFAIFIVQNITVGDVTEAAKIAGFAALFYWGVKSILQIPIGLYLDRIGGEKDDFWFMVTGTFITGLVPFGFLFAFSSWHIYLLQVLYALGRAMVVPSWSAVYTRHIDPGREAIEWSADSTVLGIGIGLGGAFGGLLVAALGFQVIFVLVGGFTMISVVLLLFSHRVVHPKDGFFPNFFPLTKKKTRIPRNPFEKE